MIKSYLAKHSITYLAMNIFIITLILLPKNFNTLFGIIPIRSCLAGILFLIFLYEKKKGRIIINQNKIFLLTLFYSIFLLFTIPSFFKSKNLLISIYTFFKYTTYYLAFITFYKTKLTKNEYLTILKNICICSFIVGILAIFQYIFNWQLNYNGLDKYDIKGRAPATFYNPIYYSIFVNIVFIPILYLIYTKNVNKILGFFILFINTCGLVLTFTRSSILIFFVILIATIIFFRKLIFNKFSIFTLTICLLTMFIIPGAKDVTLNAFQNAFSLFTSNTEEIENDLDNNEEIDYSIYHRKEFLKITYRIIENNPYIGVGFGAYIDYMNSSDFDLNYPDYSFSKTHPHAGFTLLTVETGIFAVSFFIFFIITLAFYYLKDFIYYIKIKSDNKYPVLIALLISAGFLIVNIVSENLIYDTQIFLFFLSVIAILYNLADKKDYQN